MADEQETKQDLIKAAKGLPPTERFSLEPRTFDEAFRFANLIAESTLIPKEFQKNPANVLIAVQYGMELGVSPMQALQSMYVVNGRPSIFGDLLPAIVYGSKLCEQFDEEGDEKQARCTVKRKGFAAITRTFSWEDAKRAMAFEGGRLIPLVEKQTYKSYPKRMLQMRARAWAVRDAFPDALKGLSIREEIDDAAIEIVASQEQPIAIAAPQVKKGRSAGSKTQKEESNAPESETKKVASSAGVAESPTDQQSKPASQQEVQKEEPKSTEKDAPQNVQSQPAEKPAQVGKPWEDTTLSIKDRVHLWIDNADEDELNSKPSFLSYNLSKLDIDDQVKLCRLYDLRRRNLTK